LRYIIIVVESFCINKNETFTFKNIDTRRPCSGIPAETIDKIIGKKSKIKIDKDYQIKLHYIK